MTDVYLTAAGSYLPGEPLDPAQAAVHLGTRLTPIAHRILAANGIRTRHYAADGERNEDLAAEAVIQALKHAGLDLHEVGMLAAGTTQGDLRVPGFGSMVHGRLGGAPMEVLSAAGVCASGMSALAAAERALRSGVHDTAVVVGSELASRALRAGEDRPKPHLDEEFLRWTLSDGAGAVVLHTRPRADGLSLRLDWTHLVSHAHEYPVCMYEDEGRLRQDVSLLPQLFAKGVEEFAKLAKPDEIDHLLCHYSAEKFRGQLVKLLQDADLRVDEQRWFSNLASCGNTGAASIFIMLEEAWRTGRFQPGDRILLAVPESGRFSFGFAHLTCVAGTSPIIELARVWQDFETQLSQVPIVARIESGQASIDDYRRLLVHMRQQVVEGGRWISRAASNFSDFTLRSAAIRHAAEEHGDFQMLERDFCAVGGSLDEIRGAPKNIGSEALSAFMFQQASRPDPVDLLGAMFIIEGLGTRKALGWARMLQEQLDLSDDQVSFLRYHAEADDGHLAKLHGLLDTLTPETLKRVVRTAEVVARLYAMQLSEVDR